MTLVKEEDLRLNDDEYLDVKIRIGENIFLEVRYSYNEETGNTFCSLETSDSIFIKPEISEIQRTKNQVFRLFPVSGKPDKCCYKIANNYEGKWYYLSLRSHIWCNGYQIVGQNELILKHCHDVYVSTDDNNDDTIWKFEKKNYDFKIYFYDESNSYKLEKAPNKYIIFKHCSNRQKQYYRHFANFSVTSTKLENMPNLEINWEAANSDEEKCNLNLSIYQSFSLLKYTREVKLECNIFDLEYENTDNIQDAIENDIDDSYLDIIDVDMGVKLVQSYQWRKTVTQQCSFEFREDVSTNVSVHFKAGFNFIAFAEMGFDANKSHSISKSNGYAMTKTQEYTQDINIEISTPGQYKVGILFYGMKNGVTVPFRAKLVYSGKYKDDNSQATKQDVRKALQKLHPNKDFAEFYNGADGEYIYKQITGNSKIKAAFRKRTNIKRVTL